MTKADVSSTARSIADAIPQSALDLERAIRCKQAGGHSWEPIKPRRFAGLTLVKQCSQCGVEGTDLSA